MMYKQVRETAQRSLYMTNEKELEGGLGVGVVESGGLLGDTEVQIRDKSDLFQEKR